MERALDNVSYLNWIWAGLVLVVLVMISIRDIRTMEIPHKYNVTVALLGIAAGFLFQETSWPERGIGIFCMALPMILMNLIRKDSFGGGDIFLVAAGGILLGWQGILNAGLIALVAGGILAAILLISGKKNRQEHFPFGPCLALGIGWMAVNQVLSNMI